MNILFVHGYSETSLGAYFDFPNRLQQRAKTAGGAPLVGNVVLSAFNSLDDGVTIDDLADALEQRVSALGPTWTDGPWAVICHSTGALIARRWILNRLGRAPIPTHLITLSGANHGSTLAEMGKSVLGYVQKLLLKGSPTVG
ncbi:MAG: phospholipase, partial [Vulcanimicrobiaceae bacterium]